MSRKLAISSCSTTHEPRRCRYYGRVPEKKGQKFNLRAGLLHKSPAATSYAVFLRRFDLGFQVVSSRRRQALRIL